VSARDGERLSNSRVTLAVAAVGAVCLLAVTAVAGVWPVEPGDGPGPPGVESTLTPVPVADLTDAPSPTAEGLPPSCPAPPSGAHPATLRPEPVTAAVSTGLEGWSHEYGLNVSVFRGPNELSVSETPVVRHRSTYRTPAGEVVGLTLDRWPGPGQAREAAAELTAEYDALVVWGSYTLASARFDGADAPGPANRTELVLLLAESGSPTAGKLGRECVSALPGTV
jgi:hypothetical protein